MSEQSTVRARVLTGAGWLEGNLHLPKSQGLADFLSQHAWYAMTDVVISKVGTLPFFALSRNETLLVASSDVAPAPAPPTDERRLAATLLLTAGAVDGTLSLATGVRLSDFVERTQGFMPVHAASVKVWADPGAQYFEELLVNPQRLVGVTEPETTR